MTRKMNDKLFWAIKTMLAGGATISETAEFFELGHATVSRVKASENMTEYHNILAATCAKQKAQAKPVEPVNAPATQVVEHRQSVTVQATHYMESELRKQTEALELISRKLTATLDAVNALLGCWKND